MNAIEILTFVKANGLYASLQTHTNGCNMNNQGNIFHDENLVNNWLFSVETGDDYSHDYKYSEGIGNTPDEAAANALANWHSQYGLIK